MKDRKFSVELVKNGKLDNNSAVYFDSKKEVIEYCKKTCLEDNTEFYVTVFDGDTWYYDKESTMEVNKICVSRETIKLKK